MEPDEPDHDADTSPPIVLILIVVAVATVGLALLVRRLRRSLGAEIGDEIGGLAAEGTFVITEAIIDELFAS